jgi:hypothetical protein
MIDINLPMDEIAIHGDALVRECIKKHFNINDNDEICYQHPDDTLTAEVFINNTAVASYNYISETLRIF